MKIVEVHAREILDSKGVPTVEAEVTLEDGTKAMGGVPSGASTGAAEVLELRDGDKSRYFGKGVLKAVANVNGPIKDALVGQDACDQRAIDQTMISLDGTDNKSKLGGNATCGVSMAICRAAARSQKIPLYEYFGKLSGNTNFQLPQPLVLVLEGGKHGNWSTDCQEYFIIPKREVFPTISESLRVGAEIFHALEKLLSEKGYATGVGFEGAFMPKEMKSNEEALQILVEATEKAGYKLPDQIVLGVDGAASEFYQDGRYVLKSEGGKVLESGEWLETLVGWSSKYPIWSMEDIFAEEDWKSWVEFTKRVGDHIQVVGDDLLTTNIKRIQKGIDLKAVNSVLIKLNQIGTVSETIDAILLSHKAGFTTMISHRGGETNDDMIADLCVGSGSWQSKFGGPDRGERVAKYNRLLRIEEKLLK
ncbi:MAG: phosphopyruvate hydratase [Patescibacteria group bacterium]|nr:phosphopyruvate hydratase [Patescibacteria group bacterium]